MNTDAWWIALVKLVGIPGAIAAYFMVRDWMFMAESIKLQTQMVELLRHLAQTAKFGG